MESIDEEIKQGYVDKFYKKDKNFIEKNKSVIFLFLIAIFIVVMIFTIVVLVKNLDLIKKDPLIYGMERMKYSSCQCADDEGIMWYVDNLGYNKLIIQ